MQGKIINGFELKNRLGVGGMAEVWYAENEIHMSAAVKILNRDLSLNDSIVERFRNEAEIMVKLHHQNIRQVLGYGSIDGRPAIIMEYLEGDDLKARMKQGQRFTNEELKRWWNQLVDALNYTHKKGIVHRDIKPGNIFVDNDGNIKLLDFGIAKVRESISSTQTGQKIGTLMYMSPEQVKDSKHVDYHADIYSLAVTFVHLLTGERPYDSDASDYDIMNAIVTKPLDLNGVPSEWRGFLAPYLEKDPAKRPALRHFEAVAYDDAKDETIAGGTSTDNDATIGAVETDRCPSPKQDKKPAPKKKKSFTWLWILLAVLGVGAGVFVMMNNNNDNVKENVEQPIETLESPEPLEPSHSTFDQDTFGRSQAHVPEPVPEEPVIIDKDTEDFNACETIDDYRSYIADYGRNGKHYSEAKAKIDKHVNDSLQKANTIKNKSFTVNGVTFEMIAVKGGTFTMGCTSEQGGDCYDDEKPSHNVTLDDYYIGKFKVTQKLWKAVMGSTPNFSKGDDLPIMYVSWNECQEFVRKLNQLTGQNFRLPTEAEWEYAARGGNKSNGYKYSGSNNIDNVAWYGGNSGSTVHPVGTKSPNELGIYDMSGNVWEWCQDWYGNYSSGSQTNPTGPANGSYRVYRGGSWGGDAKYCRVSSRYKDGPACRYSNLGFRLASGQ